MRYADDFVVMCRSEAKAEQAETRARDPRRARSRLHPDKTRRVELRDGKEGFDFLGCHLPSRMTGRLWERSGTVRYFLQRWPSQRAMKRAPGSR